MSTITFKNSKKLHICKSPKLKSWMCSTGFMIFGVFFGMLSVLNNLILNAICIVTSFLIGLFILDVWEDVILDNDMENVILAKSTWLDRLLSRFKHTSIIPIEQITHVSIHPKKGIVLELRDNQTIPIYKNGCGEKYSELETLRMTISQFLHLERIETWTRNFPLELFEDLNEMFYSEELDEQLQEFETAKLAQIGCRNAINVITRRGEET